VDQFPGADGLAVAYGTVLSCLTVTFFIPLPPGLSRALPCTRILPPGNEEPFFGLVIVTVGAVLSEGGVLPDVFPDAILDGVPLTPELFTAATL
jgi:hypothetical protein